MLRFVEWSFLVWLLFGSTRALETLKSKARGQKHYALFGTILSFIYIEVYYKAPALKILYFHQKFFPVYLFFIMSLEYVHNQAKTNGLFFSPCMQHIKIFTLHCENRALFKSKNLIQGYLQ